MRQYILLGVICEFILALFVKTARWAIPIIALGLIQAEVVQAFSIYNDTSGDVTVTLEDANLPAGEFSHTIPAYGSWACGWSTVGCNPAGKQDSILIPNVSTSRSNGQFTCALAMQAGGWLRIQQHDRDSLISDDMRARGLGYHPQYNCISYDVNGSLREQSNSRDLAYFSNGSQQRSVHFLAAADDQFDNDRSNGVLVHLEWVNRSRAINRSMMLYLGEDSTVRGVVYAGDLAQNGRWEEMEWHLESLSSQKRLHNGLGYLTGATDGNNHFVVKRHKDLARYVYDGLGNHDMHAPNNFTGLECLALQAVNKANTSVGINCEDPGMFLTYVRDKKRATALTGWSDQQTPSAPIGWPVTMPNPVNPHYSWDWDDVFFVQLNLFPGDEKPATGTAWDRLDPYNSLAYLKGQLSRWVGNSGRPVVLIHHYGMDPRKNKSGDLWTAAQKLAYWDAIADYNVIAIINGHDHEPGGDWIYQWNRPAGGKGTKGYIDTYNVASAREGRGFSINGIRANRGTYADVKIDNDTLRIKLLDSRRAELTEFDYPVEICKTLAGGSGPVIGGLPGDITIECDAVPGAPTGVTATDSCGQPVAVVYQEEHVDYSCGSDYQPLPGTYAPGTLRRTWTATDNTGNTTVETQLIAVVDTTVPTVLTDPENKVCLAPPTGDYVHFSQVRGMVGVVDNCDTRAAVASVSCVSNQCDDAPCEEYPGLRGDGHTVNDCRYDWNADLLSARAERALPSMGRSYYVGYTGADQCGNESGSSVGFILDVPVRAAKSNQCIAPVGFGRK